MRRVSPSGSNILPACWRLAGAVGLGRGVDGHGEVEDAALLFRLWGVDVDGPVAGASLKSGVTGLGGAAECPVVVEAVGAIGTEALLLFKVAAKLGGADRADMRGVVFEESEHDAVQPAPQSAERVFCQPWSGFPDVFLRCYSHIGNVMNAE